jgi:hypothetical protein
LFCVLCLWCFLAASSPIHHCDVNEAAIAFF